MQAPPSLKKNNGGKKSEHRSLRMGRGSGNGVGGGAGGWPWLSLSSLKQEMSIYFPRLNICMLKRRSSFVDLSGMHFLLDTEQAVGWGCPVKDKATSLALSSHLFIRHSPLSGETRARLLRPWAEGGQRAQAACRRLRRAGPPMPPLCSGLGRPFSARGTKHINIPHHVTDLNIDNDFKREKKVAHSFIPANAAELFKQALAMKNNR